MVVSDDGQAHGTEKGFWERPASLGRITHLPVKLICGLRLRECIQSRAAALAIGAE